MLKKIKKVFQKNWKALILIIISLTGLIFTWLIILAFSLPNPENFESRTINQSTKIFARDQKTILYEIHGEEKRTVIRFNEIPEVIKKATLAAEDAEFYQHPAFDIKGIIRGVIINPIFRGTSIQGGSTITQQLVKNTLLTPERTVTRKIKEIFLAIKLERKYTKDEILGFYLNQIPYGSNAYGIESAAKTFFGKSVGNITLPEATLLVSLPKAPSFYSRASLFFQRQFTWQTGSKRRGSLIFMPIGQLIPLLLPWLHQKLRTFLLALQGMLMTSISIRLILLKRSIAHHL